MKYTKINLRRPSPLIYLPGWTPKALRMGAVAVVLGTLMVFPEKISPLKEVKVQIEYEPLVTEDRGLSVEVIRENSKLAREKLAIAQKLIDQKATPVVKPVVKTVAKPIAKKDPSFFEKIKSVVFSYSFFNDLRFYETENDYVLSFSTSNVFNLGQAEISKRANVALGSLAVYLKRTFGNSRLEVEGHTDDLPVIKNRKRFPTNWELSAARALRVVRLLEGVGIDGSNLKGAGLGSSRPLAKNRDERGYAIAKNQLRNRRIVIRIEKSGVTPN